MKNIESPLLETISNLNQLLVDFINYGEDKSEAAIKEKSKIAESLTNNIASLIQPRGGNHSLKKQLLELYDNLTDLQNYRNTEDLYKFIISSIITELPISNFSAANAAITICIFKVSITHREDLGGSDIIGQLLTILTHNLEPVEDSHLIEAYIFIYKFFPDHINDFNSIIGRYFLGNKVEDFKRTIDCKYLINSSQDEDSLDSLSGLVDDYQNIYKLSESLNAYQQNDIYDDFISLLGILGCIILIECC